MSRDTTRCRLMHEHVSRKPWKKKKERRRARRLPCLPAGDSRGTGWQIANRGARTGAVETRDRTKAKLEVRCDSEPEPFVHPFHETLHAVPEDAGDIHPHRHRNLRVVGGWGLELRRHAHHVEVTYWRRCQATSGCPRARDTERIVRQLRSSWTWYLRAKPAGGAEVDAVFDLAGSRRAVDVANLFIRRSLVQAAPIPFRRNSF